MATFNLCAIFVDLELVSFSSGSDVWRIGKHSDAGGNSGTTVPPSWNDYIGYPPMFWGYQLFTKEIL